MDGKTPNIHSDVTAYMGHQLTYMGYWRLILKPSHKTLIVLYSLLRWFVAVSTGLSSPCMQCVSLWNSARRWVVRGATWVNLFAVELPFPYSKAPSRWGFSLRAYGAVHADERYVRGIVSCRESCRAWPVWRSELSVLRAQRWVAKCWKLCYRVLNY